MLGDICIQLKTRINPKKSDAEKKNHEKAVSECKKLLSFIKNGVEINITILSKQEHNYVRI